MRRNYPKKSARRQHSAQRVVVLPDLGANIVDIWRVRVSNGSASHDAEIYGTKDSAWAYAERCAEHGAYGAGEWTVKGITGTGKARGEADAFVAQI
jgi:hypothetical protein